MIRIAGIVIPEKKRAVIALTSIMGIGKTTSSLILKQVGIKDDEKLANINEEKIEKMREIIESKHKVEGDLRVETVNNIRRLKEISSFRGVRHTRNLPVRGQRTKTNARTKRGKKVTVGSGRKKSAEKT